jgi:hypothetical protein
LFVYAGAAATAVLALVGVINLILGIRDLIIWYWYPDREINNFLPPNQTAPRKINTGPKVPLEIVLLLLAVITLFVIYLVYNFGIL